MCTKVGRRAKRIKNYKRLHPSSKSDKELKWKTLEALVHPSKVWKKDIFKS